MGDYSTQVAFTLFFVISFQLQYQVLISKLPSRVGAFPPSHGNSLLLVSHKNQVKGIAGIVFFVKQRVQITD